MGRSRIIAHRCGRSVLLAGLLSLCLLPHSLAIADETPLEAPTATDRPAVSDEGIPGLFLRFSVGSGFSSFSASYSGHSLRLQAAAIVPEIIAGVQIGSIIKLYGGLSGAVQVSPGLDMEIDRQRREVDHNMLTQVNLTLGGMLDLPTRWHLGLGAGISYLLIGLNKKGVTSAAADVYGVTINPLEPLDIPEGSKKMYSIAGTHHLGFVATVSGGKEFDVGEHASIGVAAMYLFAVYPSFLSGSMAEASGNDRLLWYGHTIALLFTASMR